MSAKQPECRCCSRRPSVPQITFMDHAFVATGEALHQNDLSFPFGHAYRPQSSSASRLTAGALGFFTFTQCADRPRPIRGAKPLRYNAFAAEATRLAKDDRTVLLVMLIEHNAQMRAARQFVGTEKIGCPSPRRQRTSLLHPWLRHDADVGLRRLPTLRILLLGIVVGDRAGDDHVLALLPVHRSRDLVRGSELERINHA
jgi:hypothetical protein